MFSGLTSRCTSPARCAADSALSTGSMIEIGLGRGEPAGRRSRIRSRSVRPSTSSITRNTWCPPAEASSPWSYTATVLTWVSRAAARASRANRSLNSGSDESADDITLTATRRSSRSSTAAYTVDIPPRAMRSRIR